MKPQWALYILAAASSGTAQSSWQGASKRLSKAFSHRPEARQAQAPKERASTTLPLLPTTRFLTEATQKFAVNGSTIPDVLFDIGESYAGLLPFSNNTDDKRSLFYWFFPTANPEHQAKEEVTIWLNGGPGCSSLLGLLKENGPFLWQSGTPGPQPNPWSWHLLTNIVYVEQPVGVGFSQGMPSITNEDELAAQFMGFWRNFVDLFGLHGWKVYIVAESYGGFYGPYIASNFIDANDTDHFNVAGLMVYDGIFFDDNLQMNIPAQSYIDRYKELFALDDAVRARVDSVANECGFTYYYNQYLMFPPAGPQPYFTPGVSMLPDGTVVVNETCYDLWDYITDEVYIKNPCFNIYSITDHCPTPLNPLGYMPYFNRDDVKKAINAPDAVTWKLCNQQVFNTTDGHDTSPPSGLKELPHVIDKTQNVILAQGSLDWILVTEGVLLGIQNMTWGGQMGFQNQPHLLLQGTVHTERGLTLVAMQLAGHEGPQYLGAAAFRQLEKLLGRVQALNSTEPFTLPALRDIPQLQEPLGKGIVAIF
ncbi:serine carboxypeptidase [Trichoderma citrinoviride]|uniref:Carboxypeptidase n=1 Tax=Trichoderma citrinoviride TaxID=58853 RepID=A0A2T4B2A1_9HYPO|nr:serine carboxypeptidase [Trichoderma citrinoviride]PTB63449.1 serine carboxypeptidase [Trichoderma citrinoviride]